MFRKLYYTYSERYGECEGMFDKDGFMLGFWSCNDASWNNAQFAPFMKTLGFEVIYGEQFEAALEAKALETWGDYAF